jgi:hypothetical protein
VRNQRTQARTDDQTRVDSTLENGKKTKKMAARKQTKKPKTPNAPPLEVHPIAKVFPAMGEAEFQQFKRDIEAHGQRDDIVIHNGLLLDGRNRLRACIELGIDPQITELIGESNPVAYVVSKNLHRRQLTESQRAMVAAEITTQGSGQKKSGGPIGPPEVTNSDAAKMLNVGATSVKRAKAVKDKGSDKLKAAVTSGKMRVGAAAKIARKPKEEQDAIVDAGSKPSVRKAVADRDTDTTGTIASIVSEGVPATQADHVPIRRTGSRRMITPGTAAPTVAEGDPEPPARMATTNCGIADLALQELLAKTAGSSHSRRVSVIESLLATLPKREIQQVADLCQARLV